MKMQNVFFLSGLLCVANVGGMNQIPSDALTHLTKFLWMDTSWVTVRCVLALQQTCRLWHTILNDDQKKKIVSQWICGGKDFDEQSCLHHSLQAVGLLGHDNTHFNPEFFLLAGARVNYITEYGDSVLMFAVNAQTPSIPYICMLINMGIAINHQNFEGFTALHFAVRNVALECVEVLLLHGADKNLINLDGKMPAESFGSIRGLHGLKRGQRVIALLKNEITPEESMANPIGGEDKAPNAIGALDALLDDDNTAPINENFFG